MQDEQRPRGLHASRVIGAPGAALTTAAITVNDESMTRLNTLLIVLRSPVPC